MSADHTPGRLEVADGRRIGITLPNEVGGGFDSHCVALTFNTDGRLDAEANARRLVACWNACEHMKIENIEELANIGGVPALIVYGDDVKKECDELLAALEMAEGAIVKTLEIVRAAIAKVRGAA